MSEVSQRLDDIPGVGPLIATALVASIPDPRSGGIQRAVEARHDGGQQRRQDQATQPQKGDLDGVATWRPILRAVEELQREIATAGDQIH